MRYFFLCLFLLIACEVPESALPEQPAPADPEAVHVAAAVDRFTDAISRRDTTAFRAVMLPEGAAIALYMRDGEPAYGWRMVDGDIAMLAASTEPLLERVWEPEIRIDGMLASVWARYDFYQNEAFSHCGTDAFHLVKTNAGWKIASIIFTIEPDVTLCPDSPLGDPVF